MLLFDPATLQPQWRQYQPGVSLFLRPLSRDALRRLRQQAMSDTAPDVDRAVLVHAVVDWEGIVDEIGAKVPVTEQNVALVMDAFLHLADWTITQAMTLSESVAADRAQTLGK
jgi:hypothetical protein